jgi:hypothetical protein
MDTQLSANNELVSRIKTDALYLGIFEAFLEAAPQFIFQVSISSTFYEQLLRQYSCAKKLQSQTVTREKLLCKTLSYKKALIKC